MGAWLRVKTTDRIPHIYPRKIPFVLLNWIISTARCNVQHSFEEKGTMNHTPVSKHTPLGLECPLHVSGRQTPVYRSDCSVLSVITFPQIVRRSVTVHGGRLMVNGDLLELPSQSFVFGFVWGFLALTRPREIHGDVSPFQTTSVCTEIEPKHRSAPSCV